MKIYRTSNPPIYVQVIFLNYQFFRKKNFESVLASSSGNPLSSIFHNIIYNQYFYVPLDKSSDNPLLPFFSLLKNISARYVTLQVDILHSFLPPRGQKGGRGRGRADSEIPTNDSQELPINTLWAPTKLATGTHWLATSTHHTRGTEFPLDGSSPTNPKSHRSTKPTSPLYVKISIHLTINWQQIHDPSHHKFIPNPKSLAIRVFNFNYNYF